MTDEKTIQKIIISSLIDKYKIFVPNAFLYLWESDMIGITKKDEVIEFEIKSSRHDYLKDFKKEEKHETLARMEDISTLPNQFYYVFGEDISPDQDIPEYAGLMIVAKQGMNKYLKVIKRAPILHNERINPEIWEKLCIKLFYKTI
jgi:hypothetical protein